MLQGPKKFICVRCGMYSKRHDYISGQGLCRLCDTQIPKEVQEARRLYSDRLPIPDRLMYLYASKQLVLGE